MEISSLEFRVMIMEFSTNPLVLHKKICDLKTFHQFISMALSIMLLNLTLSSCLVVYIKLIMMAASFFCVLRRKKRGNEEKAGVECHYC